MAPITHIVTIKSACGTYTEKLKCVSEDEAKKYAAAMIAEGNKATIKPVK